ncbi:hypothetical protein HO173_004112 [Letharia columbiana]|uniref:IPT/TIG domain-containing protein n=1 Tax=Letharia columbiana TaxID=112416 RepID=A0A8H6L721_9LECA|nr:uncharacterized protein HO173_004112 [Letharia columbiana]KAF6237911.1 hypothetical protein HO173_004112 [Letharia columbiana]
MEFDNDPFPFLPKFDEPQIFDANMNDAMEEGGLEFPELQFDSPGFWNNTIGASPVPSKTNCRQAIKQPFMGPAFSQSPESSSASDSSNNQHKRNHSSDSSRSGALAGDGDVSMNGILIGADMGDHASDKSSPATDVDLSNRAMECHFDFDSAASSPSPFSDTKPSFKPSSVRSIKMPYRCSPNAGFTHGFGPHPAVSKSSRETSPLSSMIKNQGDWPSAAGHTQGSSMDFSGQYINGAMLSEPSRTQDWPYSSAPGPASAFSPIQPSIFQQPAVAMPFASPAPVSGPTYPPMLHVHPLPPKSRVETQIPVKLTLHPVPPGTLKIHLQTHTISKSKLVAKPTPEKLPDMLELHAMLVCTSAMQDQTKRGRAFARAATISSDEKREGRRSSSGETTSSEDDEDKPANGGPVHICTGCIERERKRAARKKTKNVEEEQLWQRDEAKRTIVFNTQEVKEWQEPSPSKTGENAQNPATYGQNAKIPETAVQVDIPMRIACYCRHQEEKIGFQVIFTIIDYQNNLVAQTMTNSIVITDDHKTHGPPGAMPPNNGVFPDNAQVPGAGVFSQAPAGSHGLASFRNAYSTTDLQGMQQHFNPQHRSPFAIPQFPSQTTSATLTPRNLSRQASPSAPSAQHNKKRKASGSGRIRNDLTMTKLKNPTPNSPISCVSTTTQSTPQGSNITSAFMPNFAAPSHGLPMPQIPPQFNTNPPTPTATDGSFFSSAQRSQSMENLQGFSGVFSAPVSVHPSRVPSPTFSPLSNGLAQSHAQMLANSLHCVPGAANPQRAPVIHKLTPGEASKSGGIEVTCLGSGFRQGLEVMFGDAQATTTTFWGESALVCLVPPALEAGTVPVTFKHNYEQNIPSPSNKQALFRYVDDDEQELMKHALALINRKWNGNATDAGNAARNIINQFGSNSSFTGGSIQGNNQHRHAGSFNAAMTGIVDLEAALLSCLDIVDLDDSPYQARLNTRGINGQSMLHLSASLGHYRLAAGLLARGANPDLRDYNGMTPMHMACLRGHAQIIRKLRSAGGDPNLRSLNGYVPADMATSQQTRDASSTFDHQARPRSAGATPVSHWSRASSVMSYKSSRGARSKVASPGAMNGPFTDGDEGDEGDEGLAEAYMSQPATPAQIWAQTRRNSFAAESQYPGDISRGNLASTTPFLAVNPAMSAWRDQLSAQIQQFQQTVQRTLPTLQLPALPPIPNLPDYQAYPVVRRISSMVPQRNPRPSAANRSTGVAKVTDYHWWELLTGAAPSPPAYDEIYPESSQRDLSDKKTSALRATGDVYVDRKCEETFDQTKSSSAFETANLGSTILTPEQLRSAHAMKVKRLRKDRNLFFIWIPLLVLVLVAMLKDRVPQALHGARQALYYAQDRLQERVVEIA